MKVLIVGNGSLYKSKDGYSVNKHTKCFCDELSVSQDVSFLQFYENLTVESGVQDSSLESSVKVYASFINSSSNIIIKIFCYLKLFLLAIPAILRNDFVYIFYPGNASKVISLICILLRKKFGLYIRGQGSLYSSLEVQILKKASFCLCVSENFKNDVEPYCSDVELIRPMIDFSEKDLVHTRDYSLNNQGKITCLFVGRVSSHKGLNELSKAYDLLNNSHLKGKVKFNIVGAGELTQELSSKYSMDENFALHGVISEKELLKSLYLNSDVFILPSYKEGFPRVIYESMIVGLPIVTTMVGGISTLLRNNHSCIEIGVGNATDIAGAIERLYSDIQLRENISKNALKQMSSVFKRCKHSELLNMRLAKNYDR